MIIGLTGYARTGKDTVANLLVREYDFVRVGFADALKEITRSIDPWLQPVPPGPLYIARLSEFVAIGYDEDALKSKTDYREFLKGLGNGVRVWNPSFWLDVVEARISAWNLGEWGKGAKGLVVPDVRFKNEADMLRVWGGKIIRVVREGYGPESDFELASDEIISSTTIGGPDVPSLEAAARAAYATFKEGRV